MCFCGPCICFSLYCRFVQFCVSMKFGLVNINMYVIYFPYFGVQVFQNKYSFGVGYYIGNRWNRLQCFNAFDIIQSFSNDIQNNYFFLYSIYVSGNDGRIASTICFPPRSFLSFINFSNSVHSKQTNKHIDTLIRPPMD